MKITKLGSAPVLVEANGKKILCDPWLTDGIYYGSWFNYPPIDMDAIDFSEIDYVYVSHVHPDHFDPKTMDRIDRETPVLIHRYHRDFLRRNIERLGFTVVEIENAKSYDIGNGAEITIYAADNCDPQVCGQMFGCITSDLRGSLQLDSLCVITDSEHTLVNTNDCPEPIARNTLHAVKERFGEIDFALVGYTSASLYPHCMMHYDAQAMEAGRLKARGVGLNTGLKTLRILKPKYFMPFAGTYVLGGSNAAKNTNLSIPELQDAAAFFRDDAEISAAGSQPVLLNFQESFDLATEVASQSYEPIDPDARDAYIRDVASKAPYTYEVEDLPAAEDIMEMFRTAAGRMAAKRKELKYSEPLDLLFDLPDGKFARLALDDEKAEMIDGFDARDRYMRVKVDPRLLVKVLSGPRFANWNNIEIGAHLELDRKPDVYVPTAHVLLNSLHI